MLNLLIEDTCTNFEQRLETVLEGLGADMYILKQIGVKTGLINEGDLYKGGSLKRRAVKKCVEAIGISYKYLLNGEQPIFTNQKTASLYYVMSNMFAICNDPSAEKDIIQNVGKLMVLTSERILFDQVHVGSVIKTPSVRANKNTKRRRG